MTYIGSCKTITVILDDLESTEIVIDKTEGGDVEVMGGMVTLYHGFGSYHGYPSISYPIHRIYSINYGYD
jgi:hypothetical protein